MSPHSIRKVCPNCETSFDVPLVRGSFIRELLLVFYPCPHCGFSEWPFARKDEATCLGCGTPFWLETHYAVGYSKRCYRKLKGYP